MIPPKYHFYLQCGEGADNIRVYPIYGESVSQDIERESGEWFSRNVFNGKLTFLRADYARIVGAPFDTVYYLHIYKDTGVQMLPNYLECQFTRTDCEIDKDNQSVTVSPSPNDEYSAVLAGIEKQYNLTDLKPAVERMVLTKRPLIQVYRLGDSVVSCFLGGMAWEQDCEIVETASEMAQYSFTEQEQINQYREIVISQPQPYFGMPITPAEVLGVYRGYFNEGRYYNDNGYYIAPSVGLLVLYSPDGRAYFNTASGVSPDPADLGDRVVNMVALEGATGTPTMTVEMTPPQFYARYLVDVELFNGVETNVLPADDIVPNNRNYRRAIGIGYDAIFSSMNFSDEPTGYGVADNGKYYAPPYTPAGETYYPIARSTWADRSYWFKFDAHDEQLERAGRKLYTLRDAYPLWSVISVLLKEIAPEITHEPTSEYSQFLYGEGNPISTEVFRLMIAPKSNILAGDYQIPAQKTPITLREVLTMLRNVFQCYWFIDRGMFRIEHVEFFRNGGSYDARPTIGYDLPAMINPRNGKSWAYNTAHYTFAKQNIPERYEFNWGDDVTAVFEGNPIEVLSPFAEAGKIEQINVGNYTSDIDYMLLAPEEINEDGFAVFATTRANVLQADEAGTTDRVNSSGSGTSVTTTPYYPIIASARGRKGTMRASFIGSGTGVVLYLDENQVPCHIGLDVFTATATPSFVDIPVDIPSNAAYITFYIDGTITATVLYVVTDLRGLPFVDIPFRGQWLSVQNGLLAYAKLHPNYWRYDMPAPRLKINGEEVQALSVKRTRQHTITFPEMHDRPAALQLVKSSLGNGVFEKYSLYLSSNVIKATLNYDLE